jgi:LEA14-like dessication related protein
MKRSRILKFLLVFIGILILAGGVLFYIYNPKKAIELILPDLSKVIFINATIKQGDSVESKAAIIVQNRSPYKLSIDSVFFKVELNKKKLIEEFVPVNIKQIRNQVDTVELPIDFSRKKFKSILTELKGVDSTDLDAYCYVIYKTVFGRVKLDYSKTFHIPVPIPPQIKVVKVERKKYNVIDKVLETIIQLEIINKGKNIDLQLQHIQYNLKIGSSLSSEGVIDKTVTIKPQSNTFIELPVNIKVDRPLKTIMDILTDNDKANYVLHLRAEMIEHMVGKSKKSPIPVEIEAEGMLELKK